MEIKFVISADKIQRVVSAIKYFYPVPLNPATKEPLFTDNQWAKEKIRQFILETVRRYEQKLAQDQLNQIEVEDNLVQ